MEQEERIQQFIDQHNITHDYVHFDPDNPPFGEYHFKVTIFRDESQMEVEWHTGSASMDSVEDLARILESIVMDIQVPFEKGDFEEFCSTYGYDEDSRKAEKIFKACEAELEKMRGMFSEDELEYLLYGTDGEEE